MTVIWGWKVHQFLLREPSLVFTMSPILEMFLLWKINHVCQILNKDKNLLKRQWPCEQKRALLQENSWCGTMTGCFQSKSLDKISITREKKWKKNLGDFGEKKDFSLEFDILAGNTCYCEQLIGNTREIEPLMWKWLWQSREQVRLAKDRTQRWQRSLNHRERLGRKPLPLMWSIKQGSRQFCNSFTVRAYGKSECGWLGSLRATSEPISCLVFPPGLFLAKVEGWNRSRPKLPTVSKTDTLDQLGYVSDYTCLLRREMYAYS